MIDLISQINERYEAVAVIRRLLTRVSLTQLLAVVALVLCGIMVIAKQDLALLTGVCLTVALGLAGYFWYVLTSADEAERHFLPRIFLIAFALRSVTTYIIYNYLSVYFSFDSTTYQRIGQGWSAYWRHLAVTPPADYLGYDLYSRVTGVMYYFTNDNLMTPSIVNAFIGALIPCLLYKMGKRYFGGEAVGQAAAVIGAFLTAWVMWSSITMRDIFIIFCVTLTIRECLVILDRFNLAACLRILLWLGLLYSFRPYAVVMLAVALAMTFTFALSRKPLIRAAVGLVLLAGIAGFLLVGGLRAVVLDVLQNETQQLDGGRQAVIIGGLDSSYGSDVRYHSPLDVLEYEPIGLIYFLGGPFLWYFNARQMITVMPEIISWYFILYYGLRGYLSLRGRNPLIFPLVALFVVGSLLLSAISGNFFVSIRHRSMLSVSLVLLAAVGWTQRPVRWRQLVARPA